ncbi:MAG TPA: hypothetical protein VNA26_05595 [Chitinophagaceae bacterium]|nr:hypothetical protein [Chitinophagaceae bacterium]
MTNFKSLFQEAFKIISHSKKKSWAEAIKKQKKEKSLKGLLAIQDQPNQNHQLKKQKQKKLRADKKELGIE